MKGAFRAGFRANHRRETFFAGLLFPCASTSSLHRDRRQKLILPLIVIAAALAIAACSNGDGDGPMVVHTVSDMTGAPVAGVRVQVEDQPWVTTGADGTATFEAVSGPFTVRIHQSHSENSTSIFALRRRTGSEVIAEVSSGPSMFLGAQVSGTVAGRSGPPSNSVLRVGVAPVRGWSTWSEIDDYDSFDVDVPFRGASFESSATLVLHAWESDGASPPGHYYGFGDSASLSLLYGDVITGVPLYLNPVTEGTVEGVLSLPAALASEKALVNLDLDFSRYEQLTLAQQEITPGSFAFVVPSVGGAEAWIRVRAFGSSAWHHRRVVVPSSGLAFAPPAEPELLEPATEGAAIGDATVFRWSPVEPGGSAKLYVTCNWSDPVSGYSINSYEIEAEGNEAILPNLPDVAVAPGAECSVVVHWCVATDPAVEERCSQTGRDTLWQ